MEFASVFQLELGWTGSLTFPPRYISDRHVHDFWELMYIVSGEGWVSSSLFNFPFTGGDLVIYPPGVLHTEALAGESVAMKLLSIIPPRDMDFLGFWPCDKPEFMRIEGNWLSEKFSQIMDSINEELCRMEIAHMLRIRAKVFEFISYLYMYAEQGNHSGNNARENEHVARTKGYIAEHYAQHLKLEDIAAETYISVYYLSHIFKERTGNTPMQFALSLRMQKARELLEGTDLPIRDISLKVGYENVQYFSGLFHKKTGMSPRAYRNQFRKPR